MIPLNIDLTANSDFSRRAFFFHETEFWMRSDVPLSIIDEGDLMTTDEYDIVSWWQGIFGRKGHPNRKYKIFSGKASKVVDIDRNSRTFPWNTDINNEENILPWKRGLLTTNTNRLREIQYNRAMEIFSLR